MRVTLCGPEGAGIPSCHPSPKVRRAPEAESLLLGRRKGEWEESQYPPRPENGPARPLPPLPGAGPPEGGAPPSDPLAP